MALLAGAGLAFIPEGSMSLASEVNQISCRLPLNKHQLADGLKMKLGSHASRTNLQVYSVPPNYLKCSPSLCYSDKGMQTKIRRVGKAIVQRLLFPVQK